MLKKQEKPHDGLLLPYILRILLEKPSTQQGWRFEGPMLAGTRPIDNGIRVAAIFNPCVAITTRIQRF